MDKVIEFDEKTTKRVAEAARRLMDGVTTLANTRGLTHNELECVYNVGFTYYNTGKFDEANKIFTFLCIVSHTTPKFWTALGAVRQVRKDYEGAIKAYATAAIYDIHQPKPHYYSAECAFLAGKLDMAESGCRTLLHYTPAAPGANNEYRAKAEKLLKLVLAARERKAEK